MTKILSVLILTIFLFKCTSAIKEDIPLKIMAEAPYMDNAKIVEGFNLQVNGQKAFKEEELTKEGQDRLNTIIRPLEDIISEKDKKEIKSNRCAEKKSCKILEFKDSPRKGTDRRMLGCEYSPDAQIGGTCTAWGLAHSVDSLACKPNLQNTSKKGLWSLYRQYSVESATTALFNNKVGEEKFWPNSLDNPLPEYEASRHLKLIVAPKIYNTDQVLDSLDAGYPVYVGMTVTKSLANGDSILNPNSAPTSGGHAMSFIGYQMNNTVPGGGYYIVKNSWGTNTGDRGYHYMPFNYCTRTDMYCLLWSIQKIESKYLGPVVPTPKPCTWKKVCTYKYFAFKEWRWDYKCENKCL